LYFSSDIDLVSQASAAFGMYQLGCMSRRN